MALNQWVLLCPSSTSGDVDAVITDHALAHENETGGIIALASNTITVGGTPSKFVTVQDGAIVKLAAPNSIGFGSGVRIEQGGTVYAVPDSVLPTGADGEILR